MAEPSAPRVAIKFGASSNASKKPSQPAPSTALGKRQRTHFHADPHSEDEQSDDGRHEDITHFGANGAEFVVEERPRRDQPRTDKRGNSSRKRGATEVKKEAPEKDEVLEEDEPIKFGLTVSKKVKEEGGTNDNDAKDQDKADSQPPKNADEEAIDALLGKGVDSAGQRGLLNRTEDDAYRESKAYNTKVDDMATYDEHPVEGFGASLLKGQGWDGKMRGPKAKEVIKRPNLIGLGAKKLNADEDLGGWDHKGKNSKRPRLDEYRRDSDRERSKRDDKHRDSYKNERDRDRDRERSRDRGRDSHRHRERDHRR